VEDGQVRGGCQLANVMGVQQPSADTGC
jgi:hypothetical protein